MPKQLLIAMTMIFMLNQGCSPLYSVEIPEVEIRDSGGQQLDCVKRVKQWPGVVPDLAPHTELFSQEQELPLCSYNDSISFSFQDTPPDTVSLLVDFPGCNAEPYEVPLDGTSFSHPPRPPDCPELGVRYYILVCTWGGNKAEYIFAVQIQGEFPPLSQDIDWVEISPSHSPTTYVDDGDFIQGVVKLFSSTVYQSVPADEVVLRNIGCDEIVINGNTYPRNIEIEFRQWVETEYAANILGKVQLVGDYVVINGRYYSPSMPLTNQFLEILDSVHAQGKGMTAVDVIPDKRKLTLAVIRALAEGDITPAEVIMSYEGRILSSNISSFYGNVSDNYALLIGYTNINDPICLHLIDTRTGDYLDLVEGDIDEFIAP